MALLDELRTELRQRAERIVRAGNVQLQAELRRTSPKRTGKMQKSITVRVKSVGDIIVSEAVADVEYAAPQIFGTVKNYPIRPKKAGGFLAFKWDAAPDFIRKLPDGRALLRQVIHPGLDPNPFWETGLDRYQTYLQQASDRLQ